MRHDFPPDLLQNIRDARFKRGYLIGQLMDTYGVRPVFAAFDPSGKMDIKGITKLTKEDFVKE